MRTLPARMRATRKMSEQRERRGSVSVAKGFSQQRSDRVVCVGVRRATGGGVGDRGIIAMNRSVWAMRQNQAIQDEYPWRGSGSGRCKGAILPFPSCRESGGGGEAGIPRRRRWAAVFAFSPCDRSGGRANATAAGWRRDVVVGGWRREGLESARGKKRRATQCDACDGTSEARMADGGSGVLAMDSE